MFVEFQAFVGLTLIYAQVLRVLTNPVVGLPNAALSLA